MITRIDHVMIAVPDLAQGIDAYRRLGFDIEEGGAHAGRGTHNALALNADDYLELVAVRDRAEYLAASPGGALLEYLTRGGGMRYVALQSDDLAGDVAAMRARGVDVSDPRDGGRRTPAGVELRWRIAQLGPRDPLPIFFIQHLTPVDERRRQFGRVQRHPNGVTHVDRVYIAVRDVVNEALMYGRVLGLPVPTLVRGNVIKADMAVFDLGPTGLTVAEPKEAGPAADALVRRGPGPFQALYRTRSMDAAARSMVEHGVPEPARGVRNTGEQAMLVGPEHACGAWIGFVGPA
ncbi:MAG TPA: VOC family protein [Terriglobales bacterium]|nr:VOC family protein [Terriglobales bacterium]